MGFCNAGFKAKKLVATLGGPTMNTILSHKSIFDELNLCQQEFTPAMLTEISSIVHCAQLSYNIFIYNIKAIKEHCETLFVGETPLDWFKANNNSLVIKINDDIRVTIDKLERALKISTDEKTDPILHM